MHGIVSRLAMAAGLGVACWMPPLACAAGEGKSVEIWAKAGITISPEGSITALQWDGPDKPALAAVRAAIEPGIRKLQFEPGRLDGIATETETTLSLRLEVSEGANHDWAIRVLDASTGAAAIEQGPPAYPVSALRAGHEAEVVSEIEVDGEGRVTLLDASFRGSGRRDPSRQAFLDASAAAVDGWKYRVERVGGHPVAARMSVPIQFCIEASRRPWCDGSEGKTRTANGRTAPLGEAIALDSVARLRTDLAGFGI